MKTNQRCLTTLISKSYYYKIIGSVKAHHSCGITLSEDEKTVFIADFYSIMIVDVTDSSEPYKIKSIDLPNWNVKVAKKKDEQIIFAISSGGFYVINVSNVNNPKIIKNLDTHGRPRRVSLSFDSKTAFVADLDNGLLLINITNFSNIRIIGTLETPGIAYQVILNNNE